MPKQAMPKQRATRPSTGQPTPYDLSRQTDIATSMATAMSQTLPAWQPAQPTPDMVWPDARLQYHAPSLMTPYLQPVATPAMPSVTTARRAQHLVPGPKPGQSAPWTAEEDRMLLNAKTGGLSWEQIHQDFFPSKSGNACRKRYERVLANNRDPEWDDERIQHVRTEYTAWREGMWKPFTTHIGESSWEAVERMMFQQGLRGLKHYRPRHARNQSRASSGGLGLSDFTSTSAEDYDHSDDSGIHLGPAGHSRHSSDLGPLPPAPQHVPSLPGVDHRVADQGQHYR